MHEWSYAALKQLQNPKPFVITVARIPPNSFVYIGCIGVLCQLEIELPFRQILAELMPGFAEDAAEG